MQLSYKPNNTDLANWVHCLFPSQPLHSYHTGTSCQTLLLVFLAIFYYLYLLTKNSQYILVPLKHLNANMHLDSSNHIVEISQPIVDLFCHWTVQLVYWKSSEELQLTAISSLSFVDRCVYYENGFDSLQDGELSNAAESRLYCHHCLSKKQPF